MIGKLQKTFIPSNFKLQITEESAFYSTFIKDTFIPLNSIEIESYTFIRAETYLKFH